MDVAQIDNGIKVTDSRPFLPSKDFAISKTFYVELGWAVKWEDEDLALLENGDYRFYLQRYYQKDWAENTMLHLTVPDVRAAYASIKKLVDSGRFPGVRVNEPKHESYGAIVAHVWDPAGVLLHFAQWV